MSHAVACVKCSEKYEKFISSIRGGITEAVTYGMCEETRNGL